MNTLCHTHEVLPYKYIIVKFTKKMNIYTATCILYSRKAPEQEDPKTFLMHVQ